MVKKQSSSNPDKRMGIFFLVAGLIIMLSFLLFTPKVASTLFPFKRQAVWNNFVTTVQQEQKIDPRTYWEFREFYSPGYFKLKNDNLTEHEIHDVLAKLSQQVKGEAIQYPFAVFTAPQLTSVDALTEASSLTEILTNDEAEGETLFKDNTAIMYREGKIVTIVFVMPEKEMKRTVGFFEYEGKDKKLVAGKYWLNITSLRLD